MFAFNFQKKISVYRWGIILAVLGVLIFSGAVFAEGETPTEEPPTVITTEETVVAESMPTPQTEDQVTATDETIPTPDEAIDGAGEILSDGSAGEETVAADESSNGESQLTDQGADLAEALQLAAEQGTEIVNEVSGEALDLASQESTELFQNGDPWWKVGTTLYATVPTGEACPTGTTLGVTCWQSDSPITAALTKIQGGLLPTDKKLYVEAGNYNDNITITDSDTLLKQLSGIIGAGSDLITLNGNVLIENTLNGFTLSGMTILGNVTFWENNGTLKLQDVSVTNDEGVGIGAYMQNGNVEFTNVRANGNKDSGAVITNWDSTGSVKITNSSFDDNGDASNEYHAEGIQISSSGAVTLDGVSASRNYGSGINLYNFSSLVMKNVMANYNQAPYSVWGGGHGIYAGINTNAAITLENIQANYNDAGISIHTLGNLTAKNIEAQYNTIRQGLIFNDRTYEYCSNDECTETYEVTESVRKVEEFLSTDVEYDEWRFDGTNGLELNIILETYGNGFDPIVRLYDSNNHLIAEDDNSYDGWNAQIQTTLASDGVYYIRVYRHTDDPSSSYTLSVNYDESYGYYWLGGDGLAFYTDQGNGTFSLTNGYFNQNAVSGLSVTNRNTIYISSITSTNNGYQGIDLDNAGANYDCSGEYCSVIGYLGKGTVTITSPTSTGSFTANTVSGNGYSGVYVTSKGNILISNLDAIGNGSSGLYLDNCLQNYDTGVCMGAGSVTVNVTIPNWYNAFEANDGSGIEIYSTGNVVIDKAGGNDNAGDGIYVDTLGTILLTNTNGINNSGYGAYLNALSALTPKTVTVTDGDFTNNSDTGLKILTAGAISVNGVDAYGNISPTGGTLNNLPVSVFDQLNSYISSESYYFSGTAGQEVSIILTSDDFDAFLTLRNAFTGEVLITNDNGYGGTDALITFTLPSDGWYSIKISDVGLDNYGDYVLSVNDPLREHPVYPGSGIDLDNSAGTANVTVMSSKTSLYPNYDDNANMGINIISKGAITITGASASGNYRNGINLNNPTSKGIVTIQDKNNIPSSTFNNNGDTGIYVRTLGNISLSGVSASANSASGVDLDNCLYNETSGLCLGAGSVTIANAKGMTSNFNGNTGFGILAYSKGAITLTNISAQNNGLDGAFLYNQFAGSSKPAGVTVKVSGAVTNNFSGNGWNTSYPETYDPEMNGLTVFTNGAITVVNVAANNNQDGGGGLYLTNANSPAIVGITITTATANTNDSDGLYLRSRGNIALSGVSASSNTGSGVDADNCLYDEPSGLCLGSGSVTIANGKGIISNFDGNTFYGIFAHSKGAITLTNISAQSNGLDGALLRNRETGSLAGVTVNVLGTVTNNFSGNGRSTETLSSNNGLSVSSNGAITVANVIANNNQNAGGGLCLINRSSPAIVGITITNAVADYNDWVGIYVMSRGNITVTNIEGSYNADSGAVLTNQFDGATGNVIVGYTGNTMNSFLSNNGQGLDIHTNGTVTLGNIDAEGNHLTSGELFGGDMSLGTSSVSDYYNQTAGEDMWGFYADEGVTYTIKLNVSDGLNPFVFDPYLKLYDASQTLLDEDDNSGGDLNSLIEFTPAESGWYYLNISGNTDGYYMLGVNDPTFSDMTQILNNGVSVSAGKAVTVSGNQRNYFSNNSMAGLSVETPANITVGWVRAASNGTEGIVLNSQSGIGNIIVSGKNATDRSTFGWNGWNGLSVFPGGAATLTNLWAYNNGLTGIQVGDTESMTGKNILMTNLTSQYNGGSGLVVYTLGSITANQVNGVGNIASGMYIDNSAGAGPIIVTGDSFFKDNLTGYGLYAKSSGFITITKVTAENNGLNGINAQSTVGAITLSNITVKKSGSHGINVKTGGNAVITNAYSFSNGIGINGDGLHIEAVLLSLINSAFMGNEGNGIDAVVNASPVLVGTSYFGNDTNNSGNRNLYIH